MESIVLTVCVISVFAVFGLYCAMRTVVGLLFPSQQISVAVEVRNKGDAENLDILLQEAAESSLQRGAHLVVLLSVDLMNGIVGTGEELSEYYADLLDRFGAECYLIEP